MFNILLRFKVADYARWKAAFDADEAWRTRVGERNYHIFRDADDSSMVTVMLGWDDLATAQMFVNSPHFQKECTDGGVIGAPTYFFVNDIEARGD